MQTNTHVGQRLYLLYKKAARGAVSNKTVLVHYWHRVAAVYDFEKKKVMFGFFDQTSPFSELYIAANNDCT